MQNTVYRMYRSPRLPKWGVGGRQNSREKSRGGRGQGYQESESINKHNQKPRVSPIQKRITTYDN